MTEKLHTHFIQMGYKKGERRIRVLLPKNYEKATDTRFPVVYMHDGQNIFFDHESYSGRSWQVLETLERHTKLPQMIIVGIDNDPGQRMSEYAPWEGRSGYEHIDEHFLGEGVQFSEFFFEQVKPFIDENYRTKPDAKFTAMLGSSAGANISSFLGLEHEDKIGALGIFSLASWIAPKAFSTIYRTASLQGTQRIYIQVGTEEGTLAEANERDPEISQHYINAAIKYHKKLLQAGASLDDIYLDIVYGAQHQEIAWAQALPKCLSYISANW